MFMLPVYFRSIYSYAHGGTSRNGTSMVIPVCWVTNVHCTLRSLGKNFSPRNLKTDWWIWYFNAYKI